MVRKAVGAMLLMVLAVAGAERESAAQAGGPAGAIDRFLADYSQALVSGNPFLLQPYDPRWAVFKGLVQSSWFDQVVRTKVALKDRQVVSLDETGTGYRLSFVKIQEDLLADGSFSRGLAGIRIDVGIEEGRLRVVSYRTFPPLAALEGYLSSDPRTWGEEHSLVERYLYRGLEYLREGDMRNAEDQITKASVMVQQKAIPDFLMGPSYFTAMTLYYNALLETKRGEHAAAVARLDEALALHPEYAAALNLRAQLHYVAGEYEPAQELWGRSLALWPEQPAVREIAELLAQAREAKKESRRGLLLSLVDLPPSQAAQVLSPLVKKQPRDGVLVPLLAKAYWRAGDPEKAQEVLAGSRLVGKEPEATYLSARLLLKLQRGEEALALFERLFELDPGYRDSLVFLISFYAAAEQFQMVDSRLVALQESRGGGLCFALRGKYLLMAGRLLDAIGQLDKAMEVRLPSRLRTEVALLHQRIAQQRR